MTNKNVLMHSDAFICCQMYLNKIIYKSSIAMRVYQITKTIKQFDVTLVCTLVTNGMIVGKKNILSVRRRHWQALIKRMNGQVTASV